MRAAEPTDRQAEVLEYIRERIDDGMPPTRAEIARHFGFTDNAAQCHLRSLQRKGRIKLVPEIARGIRLIEVAS